MPAFFITSIGTDSGKTFVTRMLCHALRARNIPTQALKPVISGVNAHNLLQSDTALLLNACGNASPSASEIATISPWQFAAPISPHDAAAQEGMTLNIDEITSWVRHAMTRPYAMHLIEGAGGVMTPLSHHHTIRDLIKQLDVPALLVTHNYLGSISHTLCAWHALRQLDIPIAAIIVNQPHLELETQPNLDDFLHTIRSHTHPHCPIITVPYAHEEHFTSQAQVDSASYQPIVELSRILTQSFL